MAQTEPTISVLISPYGIKWDLPMPKSILKTEWSDKEHGFCTVGPSLDKFPSVMYNEEDDKVYYIGTNGRKKLKIWLDKKTFDEAEMTFYRPIEDTWMASYLSHISSNTIYVLEEEPYIEIDDQGNTGFTFYTYENFNNLAIAEGLIDTWNGDYNYYVADKYGNGLNSYIFNLNVSDGFYLKVPEKSILEEYDEIWVKFIKPSGAER